ncbi:MAG TPA: biosynthetic peptidoglycan transglycosylase, partial [Rubrobacteraceae bacterium]|nr:biosynthetic peptidoglycan transglycosylase [Rubrobacteraceae bacterium]
MSQGGSTLTEQLMKTLYISEERRGQVSPWRRFEQAALFFAYERRHTKEEVLTVYLNTVYFGDGAYGAEEAANRYFGESASELDLAEAAATPVDPSTRDGHRRLGHRGQRARDDLRLRDLGCERHLPGALHNRAGGSFELWRDR